MGIVASHGIVSQDSCCVITVVSFVVRQVSCHSMF